MRDVVDVDAARSHIGGDQDVSLLAAEQLHDAVALSLFHAAVQRLCTVPMGVEGIGDLVDFEPRPAEYDRGLRILEVEDAPERGVFVLAGDEVGRLPHARHLAGRAFFARDCHALRVVQVPSRHGQDPRRHGGGEQGGLPRFRGAVENGVQILGEAHVEHLVGLVEHQDLERGQIQGLPPEMIQRTARRGDDDGRPPSQGPDLLFHRRPAVQRHHRQVGAF